MGHAMGTARGTIALTTILLSVMFACGGKVAALALGDCAIENSPAEPGTVTICGNSFAALLSHVARLETRVADLEQRLALPPSAPLPPSTPPPRPPPPPCTGACRAAGSHFQGGCCPRGDNSAHGGPFGVVNPDPPDGASFTRLTNQECCEDGAGRRQNCASGKAVHTSFNGRDCGGTGMVACQCL